MSVTEACNRIQEAIDLVKQGGEVELTQDGEVVAVWVSPAKLQKKMKPSNASNIETGESLQEELAAFRKDLPPLPKGSLTSEQAEDLIREVRNNRDITS